MIIAESADEAEKQFLPKRRTSVYCAAAKST
jgi:hypothetical protein